MLTHKEPTRPLQIVSVVDMHTGAPLHNFHCRSSQNNEPCQTGLAAVHYSMGQPAWFWTGPVRLRSQFLEVVGRSHKTPLTSSVNLMICCRFHICAFFRFFWHVHYSPPHNRTSFTRTKYSAWLPLFGRIQDGFHLGIVFGLYISEVILARLLFNICLEGVVEKLLLFPAAAQCRRQTHSLKPHSQKGANCHTAIVFLKGSDETSSVSTVLRISTSSEM